MDHFVAWFEQLHRTDVSEGGKSDNSGGMIDAGRGAARLLITSGRFRTFIDEIGPHDEIVAVQVIIHHDLKEAAAFIQSHSREALKPSAVRAASELEYRSVSEGRGTSDEIVTVWSSAMVEDIK